MSEPEPNPHVALNNARNLPEDDRIDIGPVMFFNKDFIPYDPVTCELAKSIFISMAPKRKKKK